MKTFVKTCSSMNVLIPLYLDCGTCVRPQQNSPADTCVSSADTLHSGLSLKALPENVPCFSVDNDNVCSVSSDFTLLSSQSTGVLSTLGQPARCLQQTRAHE